MQLVVRTALPPDRLAAGIRMALRPIDPKLPVSEFQTLAGFSRQSGIATAISGAAAGRIRGFRLGTRFPRDLRRDLVFGESTSTGNWHSDGAGSVRHRPANPDSAPDAWIGRPGARLGNGSVSSSIDRARKPVVRGNVRRSSHIHRYGNAAYCGGCRRRVYSRPESIPNRSDGCIAIELRDTPLPLLPCKRENTPSRGGSCSAFLKTLRAPEAFHGALI